jgi:hypothetical protein
VRKIDSERCPASDVKGRLDAARKRAAIRRQQPHRKSRPIWRGARAGKTSATIGRGFDLRDISKTIRRRDHEHRRGGGHSAERATSRG